MTRYVVYAIESGLISFVVTGSRALAELNVREGEALIEHRGFVSAAKHRIQDGVVVPR